ncbi:MAG TPA: alpha/beta hydrolase-fold protein [Polyangiaceae bacterium]|nr:alpha/beta hydrolase-fold protein [Polyangiaceae bacterium]
MRRTALLLCLLAVSCRKPEREAPRNEAPASAGSAARAPSGAPSASPAPTAAPGAKPGLSEVTWHWDDTPLGPSDVVVLVPDGATRDAPLPVLVAFHGRGESLKGPKLGARGWRDDYALDTTVRRLSSPPLTEGDFLGFVTEERLAKLNAGLRARPYRGMIVVCPFLPDALHGERTTEEGRLLARFVVETVLPRVYRETPATGTPASTGVDGVSLGGRAALLVGFSRPEAFGVVAALQPAIDAEETTLFADLGKRAREKNPTLTLRLVTSNGDYFLEPTLALARALDTRGIRVTTDVVTGPHSYEWNRGPGGYEMLSFHDRALRGEPPL